MFPRAATLLVILAVAICGSIPCLAREHSYDRLYRQGRRAAQAGYSREAIFRLTTAIEKRTQEGNPPVAVYGRNFEPYLPYFYLGLAFFELGHFDRALEAWGESERQGAVQAYPEYGLLRDKREIIFRDVLPHYIEIGRRELKDLSAMLAKSGEALKGLRAAEEPTMDLEARHTFMRERLADSESKLAVAGQRQDIGQLEKIRTLTDRHSVEARALWRKLSKQVAALDAIKLDSTIEGILASLHQEGCQPILVKRLEELRQVVANAHPNLSGQDLRILLGLAREHLECGELDSAAHRLVAASHSGGSDDGELGVLRQELSYAREKQMHEELRDAELRDAILAGFVESTAAIDAEQCNQAAIQQLRTVVETVRSHPDRRQLAGWIEEYAGIPYVPQWFLAKAYELCGDIVSASRTLIQSRESLEDLPSDFRYESDLLAGRLRQDEIGRLYSGSHALVFLARDYSRHRNGWEDLPSAMTRAIAIQETLREAGFSTEVVRNPTKKELEHKVEEFIAAFGRGRHNRNRLLIYFAGHGWTVQASYQTGESATGSNYPIGFLVPVDATRKPSTEEEENQFIQSSISMDQVEQWATKMESIHALFILDSCFSGTIFRVTGSTRPPLADENSSRLRATGGLLPVVIQRAVDEPARQFITAGDDETRVPDNTLLVDALLAALSGEDDADSTQDGFLTGGELCVYLKDRVTPLNFGVMPLCEKMTFPYNKGDLVFPRPPADLKLPVKERPRTDPAALLDELALWRAQVLSPSANAYQRYLERYPQGRFAGLARYRLLRKTAG